jgi:hypothetical protein
MAKAKQKDARDHAADRLEGRPKALRRELSDLETELERARKRRDRAQARVEALEAIAEQLTVAIAAADAARDARRASKDASAEGPAPDTTELMPLSGSGSVERSGDDPTEEPRAPKRSSAAPRARRARTSTVTA